MLQGISRAIVVCAFVLTSTFTVAAEFPVMADFSFDFVGHPPQTGAFQHRPEYIVETPGSIFEVIGSTLGLAEQPVILYDGSGGYQCLGWTIVDTLNELVIDATFSIATFTNAYIHKSFDGGGTLVSRLEVRSDGTIRPSFPSSMVLGIYSPGEPFRIRIVLSHTTTVYRVAIDNELDGFEDDPLTICPSISYNFVKSFELGYGAIPDTPPAQITMIAIDDIHVDHSPTRSVHAPFIRGDVDGNGIVNVVDAVELLYAIYVPGTPELDCPDASDVNDTGIVDVSDSIYLLAYIFVPYSPPPAHPFPDCDLEPVEDLLDCTGSGCDG